MCQNLNWGTETTMIIRILLATLLGSIIGFQREHTGSKAGLRTYAIVTLGSCCFGLIAIFINSPDAVKITAQIVTGVGFLGAGVIIREEGHVTGLTTAATLWAASGVGVAAAYGMYMLAVIATIIILGLLSIKYIKKNHH